MALFEKFLKNALWNKSGESTQIVIHEQKGNQIILADDSGLHPVDVSDLGGLMAGVTLDDTDENYEKFWRNYQKCAG